MESPTGWILPFGNLEEQETLDSAVPRLIKNHFGERLDTWVVGKAPGISSLILVGHYTLPSTTNSPVIFFMKTYILAGKLIPQQEAFEKYAWLSRAECAEKMVPEYYSQVSDMMTDL